MPSSTSHPALLLWSKSRLTNITTPQLNTQHSLHSRQDLLIRSGRASFKVCHDTLGSVTLCSQVLLRHLGVHQLPLVGDGGSDFLADGGGLDDVVAAVDFGEVLAFDAGLGGL